jgi:hypothetical protein
MELGSRGGLQGNRHLRAARSGADVGGLASVGWNRDFGIDAH